MRTYVIAATCLALSACGGNEQPEPVETATVDPAPGATMATGVSTGNMAGTYEVKGADGTVVTEVISPDGTYTDTRDGAVVEKGKWRADGSKTCFDPDGSEPEMCYTTTAPGADGSFRTIGPDGKETGVTIRKTA